MKILVNGNTVKEMVFEKVVKVREFKKVELVKEVSFNNKEIGIANKVIEHIKRNKLAYARLVLITAIMLHFDIVIYANGFEASLDRVGNQILNMLMSFAKWGCLAMGIKDMVTTLINGGNMKNSINSGLMYLLGYVFISIYPQLFSMFQGIKF
ncbi:Uncharacterised protein [[Clostridium] sordellii]|uniref:hypothetical protein n=1 Tax=Paraclostridium sordellii TaxID=1505 RepID=UPI0005E92BE0|nr:hypothetical protein [Paeniclostridium sordellii]CEO04868.1 Uncharacterised protein [[Clostridium] sordellii] [Paeniclostridium sordellii]